MKKNHILFGLLIAISLISCQKEDDNNAVPKAPFYAMKNNSEWISTSSWANYSLDDQKITIVGVKRDSQYYEDEELYFTFKTTDISRSNTVTNFESRWDLVVGGDAISDTYIMDSTYNNLIAIGIFDTITKQVTGTFDIKLVRDKFRSDLGETMLFKNGSFKLKYTEF
jgi:hypothetical protein